LPHIAKAVDEVPEELDVGAITPPPDGADLPPLDGLSGAMGALVDGAGVSVAGGVLGGVAGAGSGAALGGVLGGVAGAGSGAALGGIAGEPCETGAGLSAHDSLKLTQSLRCSALIMKLDKWKLSWTIPQMFLFLSCVTAYVKPRSKGNARQ
jgi:hypothetical protein